MSCGLDLMDKKQSEVSSQATDDSCEDINKILPNLYISDENTSKNKKLLNDLSIKHIIIAGHELKPHHSPHFNYLHVPLHDNKK